MLVSYDSDFSDLIYRDKEAPSQAVVYIRVQPDSVADLVPRMLEVIANEDLQGHMVVIGPRETRKRPFPGREEA